MRSGVLINAAAEDPTILSGTLRSTIDVFSEYEDAEIVRAHPFFHLAQYLMVIPQYEALHRVHLIPASDTPDEDPETLNANVFRSLDSPVSEGGDNFSTGYVRCTSTLSGT